MATEGSVQTDLAKMEAILVSEAVGHLGMASEGEVYVVPINYTYTSGRILVHCALQGRKLGMIGQNPAVCFEVSRQEGPPAEHAGEACENGYESVICWGTARYVEEVNERHQVLLQFQARYATAEKPRDTLAVESAEKCGAVEIVVERMTGRRRAGGAPLQRWEWHR